MTTTMMNIRTNYYDKAFDYVVNSEGGYVDNPNDPGGPTKWGVANFREKVSAYEVYKGRQVSAKEIEDLTIDEVKRFYFQCFYKTVGADLVEYPAIATALFDTCVLYGIQPTCKMAQLALNDCGLLLFVDGVIGKITIKCLNEVDTVDFLNCFAARIIQRIDKIVAANPQKFAGKKAENGWKNRTRHLLTLAKWEPLNRKLIK